MLINTGFCIFFFCIFVKFPCSTIITYIFLKINSGKVYLFHSVVYLSIIMRTNIYHNIVLIDLSSFYYAYLTILKFILLGLRKKFIYPCSYFGLVYINYYLRPKNQMYTLSDLFSTIIFTMIYKQIEL